jgi:hypothetical protein
MKEEEEEEIIKKSEVKIGNNEKNYRFQKVGWC